jgi:hypothetical protein
MRGYDIQYGQASMKNASFEMLTTRQAAIQAQLSVLAAAGRTGGGAPAPETVPVTNLPRREGNPLTKDGAPPPDMVIG